MSQKKTDRPEENGQALHRAAQEMEHYPEHVEKMDLWKCPRCAALVARYLSACPACKLPKPER
jgi:rubrerythrin